ncbi:hypothetical protein [Marinomonas algarum]|uniref:Uncharacterized protein n=1 Tax=Marinomonas algarum TaxID=2883105 RepID=A0A9X1LFT4_9GAMM|nr:hypothetical protein [Marinomonas algarum]MCB5163166.1 hypothetical protein [Marinomonas algarum]
MESRKLISALSIARSFGLQSISQSEFFLKVAYSEPLTLLEIANTDDASSPQYKTALGQFIKLSSGSAYRDKDGLGVLRYANTGINRKVTLTTKGFGLKQRIE